MKSCLLACVGLLASLGTLRAQVVRPDTVLFGVMAYNVENLFDCRHDTLKDDLDFLPDGIRRWRPYRYERKLDNLARVITAVGGWTPPALVALCEVENDTVLADLTRRSLLRRHGYRYLMTCSEDLRGIDVALLYRRDLFKPVHWESLRIPPPRPSERPTRDILYVSGLLSDGDTLDVVAVHLPSRLGGTRGKNAYREKVAGRVRELADSLFLVRRRPRLIVLGDFNDYPESRLVRKILQAGNPPRNSQADERKLYHLLARKAAASSRMGTYKYQGIWQWMDHILVSGGLLHTDASLYTSEGQAGVFNAPFLLEEDAKFGGWKPFRTYYGMKYQGGYSDHLPVFAWFRLSY